MDFVSKNEPKILYLSPFEPFGRHKKYNHFTTVRMLRKQVLKNNIPTKLSKLKW